MADHGSVLQLQGVTKRYGNVTALRDATLTIDTNEYISLFGPSGSGRTTLLRVIAGFEVPDVGRVIFQGRDITSLPAHERGVGFVFQNFALFPHLSVFDNVAFGLVNAAARPARAEIERRAHDIIALVGLSELEGRSVHQISGGQKQRVALARTLVMAPKLVLLDEPLGALDANLRHRMRGELRTIREALGVTFLHVTGSESEALAVGDRTAVLDAGRIAQFARPDEIYAAPATPNVARFLNRFNLFEGTLEGDWFNSALGKIKVGRVQPADRAVYGIRYDRTHVFPADTVATGPSLRAAFVASEYLGSSVMCFFETPSGQVVEVEHHISLGPPPTYRPKTDYLLQWNPDDAIVFG